MKRNIIAYIMVISAIALSGVVFAGELVQTKSGLVYEDLIVGQGKKAVPGKIATIQLKMWTNENGKKGNLLFSSYDENSPISFKVGTKKVADGLNLGVNGMEVGGQRRLYVPPELNPQTASDQFPANANLIFEVELLEVK